MNKGYFYIKNARLIDPQKNKITSTSILLKRKEHGGEILEIGRGIHPPEHVMTDGLTVYNAKSRLLCASFFDLVCRVGYPGYEYREDMVSCTRAARSGGFGTILALPETKPQTDNPKVVADIVNKAEKWAAVNVLVCGAIVRGQNGDELCDYDKMKEAGAVAFSDIGVFPQNGGSNSKNIPLDALQRALVECAKRNLLVILSKPEASLCEGGVVNEGKISKLFKVRGIPNTAEEIAVAKYIILAAETGCRVHIPVISTKRSIDIIRTAKKAGVPITCGTTPHHFSLSEDDLIFYGAKAKVMPPLRRREDVEYLIEALCDGTIDCISTDHTPLTNSEKGSNIERAAFGISSIETAFTAGVTYLVNTGKMDIFRLISLLTSKPAEILGKSCKLAVGETLSFNALNLDAEIIYTNNSLKGKSYNTPFFGIPMRGFVEDTIL